MPNHVLDLKIIRFDDLGPQPFPIREKLASPSGADQSLAWNSDPKLAAQCYK